MTARSNSFRLSAGGDIDRDRPITFHFNGRRYAGFAGDTLASALLANGVRLVARSFKYHRPRGVVSAGLDEPNALVQLHGVEDEPNVRATTLALTEGLDAHSVNCWPGADFDLGAINEFLSPLLAAGFYYKTFLWPPGGWNFYAPFIRRMAGLGHAPLNPGRHHYERRFQHCDVLVVGAGPSGLCAALAAARSGADVMLVDAERHPGGRLNHTPTAVDGVSARVWTDSVVAELDRGPNVMRLSEAQAVGYYDHNLLTIVETHPAQDWIHERLWKVRAAEVILATGALERPLVFANNDRPGVMLPSAAESYIKRYAVRPGRRAVIISNNDSAYECVAALLQGGVDVAAFVETRSNPSESLRAQLEEQAVAVFSGYGIIDVRGARSVRAVDIAPMDEPHRWRRLDCDLVLASGGWNPNIHLHSQSGGKPVYAGGAACFVPGPPVQSESSVGACAGTFTLAEALAQGVRAGLRACERLGFAPATMTVPETQASSYDIEPCWEMPTGGRRRKCFVDLHNDVTSNDIRLADREGFQSVEHVKRYTTAGMGTDQGKLGNVNTIGVLSRARGMDPDRIGTTTYRPPFNPVSFGVIAANDTGALLMPSRRTPLSDWIERHGAVMFEAGAGYRRPSYFPQGNESAAAAISREALHCRQRVGMYDGSPLGKFELNGGDVAVFLNRVYTNRWDDLEVGQGRFGWMLREDGRLLDDGVSFRVDEQRYLMFTGTGAADHVHMHLERLLQLEWPELEVFLTPVTSQWANICVCGPRARDLLRNAGVEPDIGTADLPFMGIRRVRVAGHAVRIARVGYTGELSFELNLPARHALSLWRALLGAGERLGVTLVGSEASMVMRCEKGFVAAGFEGDGIVNPYDAGLGWVVDMDKGDFIGRRSLLRDRHVGGIRPGVVGLLPADPRFVPADGTPLTDGTSATGEPNVVGYVTQGVHSPSLARAIAMAVLDDGRQRIGQSITVHAIDRQVSAEITRPCFIDPEGERMRG